MNNGLYWDNKRKSCIITNVFGEWMIISEDLKRKNYFNFNILDLEKVFQIKTKFESKSYFLKLYDIFQTKAHLDQIIQNCNRLNEMNMVCFEDWVVRNEKPKPHW